MLRKIKTIILIAAILGPTTLAAFSMYKNYKLDKRNRALINDAQSATLEAAGWKQAIELKDAELSSLQESLVASQTAGTTKVVRVAGETRTEFVEVPVPVGCDVAQPSTEAPPSDTTPHSPSPQPVEVGSSSIGISNRVELALDYTINHDLYASGVVHTKLSGLSWERETSIPFERVAAEVGEDLRKALRYYERRPSKFALIPRHPRHWRMGWFAGVAGYYDPSLSVSYDSLISEEYQLPAPSVRNVGVGVVLGWGVQF